VNAPALDWSQAAADYERHRPGYPEAVFDLLARLGIGLPGQAVLDLGTGTGHLAIPFARRGARVTGVDVSAGQLDVAVRRAEAERLAVSFRLGPAESLDLPDGSLDAATASMCWGYLDQARLAPLLWAALRPGGLLLLASLLWSSEDGPVARRTSDLLRRHNPAFAERGGTPRAPEPAPWASGRFALRTWHWEQVRLPFTREGWRGRQRASKWVGAALPAAQVRAFDAALARLLEAEAPPVFEVPHTVALQIFERQG
jgi:SAM-dependent methyltransferase